MTNLLRKITREIQLIYYSYKLAKTISKIKPKELLTEIAIIIIESNAKKKSPQQKQSACFYCGEITEYCHNCE